MVTTCGVVQPCSPRGPIYSARLRARAIELYLDGVRHGYMKIEELQRILEREFPDEIPEEGEDKPSPETIRAWAAKYPDLPQRLKSLGALEAGFSQSAGQTTRYALASGPQVVWQVLQPNPYHRGLTDVLVALATLMILGMMACCVSCCIRS